jgi:hypothetical protein
MASKDNFNNYNKGLDSPFDNGADVTPHDTNELAFVPRGVYIGGGSGALAVEWKNGTTTVLSGLITGQIYWIRPRRILATGTSATNIRILE